MTLPELAHTRAGDCVTSLEPHKGMIHAPWTSALPCAMLPMNQRGEPR